MFKTLYRCAQLRAKKVQKINKLWVYELSGLEWWNGTVEWITGLPRPQISYDRVAVLDT